MERFYIWKIKTSLTGSPFNTRRTFYVNVMRPPGGLPDSGLEQALAGARQVIAEGPEPTENIMSFTHEGSSFIQVKKPRAVKATA